MDAACKISKINAAIENIFAWTPADVIGRDAKDLFPGACNSWILDSLERVVSSGQSDITMDAEIQLTEDGSRISANLTVVPLINIDDEAIGYMIVCEDISREKRIKSTMARYMTKEVADRLLESGGDMLGGPLRLPRSSFLTSGPLQHCRKNLDRVKPSPC